MFATNIGSAASAFGPVGVTIAIKAILRCWSLIVSLSSMVLATLLLAAQTRGFSRP